jgi:hypothetical protein
MSNSYDRWLGGLAYTMARVSADAAAQESPNRVTVAASAGLGSFASDESRLGRGPILGVAVRVQPWEQWGFEFDTRRFTHERRFDSGGVGIVRGENESRFPITPPLSALLGIIHGPPPVIGERVFHSTGIHVGLSVGGGVDIPLWAHWSLRPEVRSLWGAGSVLSPLDLGASLALGW